MFRMTIMPSTSFFFRIMLLVIIVLAALLGVASLPRIPQDPAYHAFADGLTYFGLINGSNVLSNAGFLFAGILGVRRIANFSGNTAKHRWYIFYLSIILVGLGSAYYHWSPSNDSLFWDRLPMTLGFASLTTCLLAERLGSHVGRYLFIPLILFGAGSVFYWWATETAGVGDLRPYIVAQYLPLLLVPFLLRLFPKGYTWDSPYWILLVGYAIAKGFEWQDMNIYQWTNQLISGHALKHLVAAAAILLFRPCLKATNPVDASFYRDK